jgi:hypothetical protein
MKTGITKLNQLQVVVDLSDRFGRTLQHGASCHSRAKQALTLASATGS